MMNGASQILLQNLSLEATLEQILNLQAQHVIELVLALLKHTTTVQTTEQSSTLEQTLGIFLVKSQQLTSGVADLGKSELYAVNLALVLQAELADELKLRIEPLLVALGARSLVDLPVCYRVKQYIKLITI